MSNSHQDRKGLSSIFANTLFQINRNLQIYLQHKRSLKTEYEWRPSAICISKNSFERNNAFKLLHWISHKYGFGTYLHFIDGYFSKKTYEQSEIELKRLISNTDSNTHVYIDTIISPSNTTAIAQAMQIPGIAGMENNMIIFEYDKENPDELANISDNFRMVNAGGFDVCILASSRKPIIFKNGIHIWINNFADNNTNLMILLSFIISGHHDWKTGNIKIFNVCSENEIDKVHKKMDELINSGRLPITSKNVEILIKQDDVPIKDIINKYSADAGITMLGFHSESFKKEDFSKFVGYDNVGEVLFIHSHDNKVIE